MKRRVFQIVALSLLFLLSFGISFVQLPRDASRLLYLLALGVGIFTMIVSLALTLVIEPLRKWINILRLACLSFLIFVGPFTLGIWTTFDYWMPFWALLSGLVLYEPMGLKKNLPNFVLTIVAFGLSFLPSYGYLPMIIIAVNALFYLVAPFEQGNRYYACFIASYAAIYCITDIPGYAGARLGLFIPMLVLAWGCLEPQIVHLRRNRIENAAIMESELQIAHIEEKALKAEIRPHFLLNALNNVRVAYHEDNEEGRKLLQELIKLESRIAEASKRSFIPISEEIEIVRGLIRLFCLERKREVEFIVDVKDKGLLIPPMLLEPLVENSLQHSGIMNQSDGEVSIEEHEEFGFAIIVVSDNGKGQPLPSQSRGIGLSNVVKRIELLEQGHMHVMSDERGTSIEIRFLLQ